MEPIINISIEELEQKIKEYEQFIVSSSNNNNNETLSTEQRDSIVDDLLSEYRSRNISPNYFANTTNVSNDAYMLSNESKESDNDLLLYQCNHECKPQNTKTVKCKRQSLAQEMAEKERENLTFKPKINKYDFNRGIDPNVQRRLQIWNAQRKTKLSQQRRDKRAEDDCKIKEQSTFAPEVKKVSITDCESETMAMPVQDRLFQSEHRRIERLAKTKEIIEAQAMAQCSFKPKINQKSKNKNRFEKERKPLWQRQQSLRAQKQSKRAQTVRKIKTETEADLTFKPKINKKSKELIENTKLYSKYYPIHVSQRLSNSKRNTKNEKIKQIKNAKPYINPTSEKILKESVLFKEASDDFFKRQQIYELERKMRESQQRNTNKSDDSIQFKPNIGNADTVLSHSKRHRHRYHFEDAQQKYERLAFHDRAVIRRKTEMRAKALHSNHTFKPKINKKSAKMGRPSSIYELFQPTKSKELKDKIRSEAQKIFERQHPFKVKDRDNDLVMVKHSQSKKGNANPNRGCTRHQYRGYQIQKKQKLLDARKRLDFEQMKECTFKPQINNTKKTETKKILVCGWDRFRELKQLSLKKQFERERRAHEVFNVSAKVLKSRRRNASGSLHTVTRPFNLETNTCNANNSRHNKYERKGKKSAKGFQTTMTLAKRRDLVWEIFQQQCEDSTECSNETSISVDSFLTCDFGSPLSSNIVSCDA